MSKKATAASKAAAAKAEDLTEIERRLISDHPVVHFAGAYEEYPAFNFADVELKPDHEGRPFWVCPNGHVYLEQYSPRYAQARDFLVQIAEPCSRPVHIHEYRLEKNALFAAASMGLTATVITDALEALSKCVVSERVKAFIRDCTVGYGKVKLVLSQGKYFLESNFPSVLRQLNKNEVVKRARVKAVEDEEYEAAEELVETDESLGLAGILEGGTRRSAAAVAAAAAASTAPKTGSNLVEAGDGRGLMSSRKTGEVESDDSEGEMEGAGGAAAAVAAATGGSSSSTTPGMFEECVEMPVRFQILKDEVDNVKKACRQMDPPFPLMREYDFKACSLPILDIRLRSPELLRDYQGRSLAKMFGNGRARSGIIVLPCGAGKTLVGISAAATIRKSCLVICPHNTSVEQWIEQFARFTTILGDRAEAQQGPVRSRCIVRLTSGSEDQLPPENEACIVFTTFSMVTMDIEATGKRKPSAANEKKLRALQSRTWGLMIVDETHQLVAKTYKTVLKFAPAHCHLGLTATLVREDGEDKHLSRLIGPKLYEANWRDLTMAGYLARVKVAEVWCPMTSEFYGEYLKASARAGLVLAVLNPNKCYALEYLIRKHSKDKIIIFSESVVALELLAKELEAPCISGRTATDDRRIIIKAFRESPEVNVLFLSKVGDVALDVPDANVLIQISFHGGSRLQEAQRMGRILRKKSYKSRSPDGFDSYFYTLLSMDTVEMLYSEKRRRYLVAQGYEYHVIPMFEEFGKEEELRAAAQFMRSEDDRLRVLRIALTSESDGKEDEENKQFENEADIDPYLRRFDDPVAGGGGGGKSKGKRVARSYEELTTADRTRYLEFDESAAAAGGGGAGTAASGSKRLGSKKVEKRPREEAGGEEAATVM